MRARTLLQQPWKIRREAGSLGCGDPIPITDRFTLAGSCDSTKTVPHRNYRRILKEDVETVLSFIHNYVNQSILSEVDSVSRLIKIETAKSLCRGRDVWGLDSPLIVDTWGIRLAAKERYFSFPSPYLVSVEMAVMQIWARQSLVRSAGPD